MRQSFLYALRRLKRGWSSGELLILLLALVVAVASSSAVSLFSSRVQAAIAAQTGDTLGADLMFSARDPLSADLTEAARATGAKLTTVVQFPSVVFQGETSALASIKAVEAGYPLRGRLLIAPEPFAAASLATALPAPGEAWMDARLWQELRLTREARIKAGASEFRVTAVLVEEPGRGAGFSDLAPRLLLNAADLAAAELLGEGSRAQYALQATGSPEQLAALQALERPQGVRLISPQDARPELQAALRNAGEFLGLARVAAALLAAAAIALCAWQYGQKARDEVALLKTLGASGDFISNALTLQLLLLGALGGSIGALLGLAAQEVIAQLLGGLMQISLPPAPLTGLLPAVALALLLLLAFAAPPLLRARHTPPLRVFQRDETALRVSPLLWLSAIGGALGLLWMQTSTLKSAAFVLGGAVAASAVLALLGALLVRVLTPLRTRGGTAWRFGLGNLARRRGATIGQAVALGLALLALLLVTVVRQDLLSTWQGRLKPDTPNQFLINIQSDQLEALRAFFARYQLPSPTLWPMARARLTALRGVEVTPDSFPDPETQRWINREFNLSWTDTLGEDNRIIEGTWWGPEGRGQSLISADDYAIKRLGL